MKYERMEEWFYKGTESGIQDINVATEEKARVNKSAEGKRKKKSAGKKKRLWRNPELQVSDETFS